MALNIKPPVIPPYYQGSPLDIKNAIVNYLNVAASTIDDVDNYILAYKSWLERRKLAFDELIDSYYAGELNVQHPVALLGTVFDISSILEAKDLDSEDKVMDLYGNWWNIDDVCEAMGNINQMYYMNISFLETVVAGTASFSNQISEFKSRCEILYGQVNAKVLEYQSTLASLLTNSRSPREALDSFMAINTIEVIEDPQDNVRWTSPSADMTGVNPFFAVLAAVEINWDPVTFLTAGPRLTMAILSGVVGLIANVISFAVKKTVSWISNNFIDPKDVICVDEKTMEPTFISGHINKRLFITNNTIRNNLWNYIYNNHPDEYLRFVLPGGTLYIKAVRDLDNGSYLDTYIKYHVYDYNTIFPVVKYITNINFNSYDIVPILNDITTLVSQLRPAPTGDEIKDATLYKSLFCSQYLLNFSIGLLAFDYNDDQNRTIGDILAYSYTITQYGIPEEDKINPILWAESTFNTTITADPSLKGVFTYDHSAFMTAFNSDVITNFDFLRLLTNEGNPDDFVVSQGPIFTFLCTGLFSIISIDVIRDEVFIPYNFVCGPSGGRYDLVPDEQHLEAARRALITIVVVAAATALTWSTLKFRKNLRLKAVEARRTAELAVYDDKISTKQLAKLNKKAIRAEKFAGIYVPDVSAMNSTDVDISEIRKLISKN